MRGCRRSLSRLRERVRVRDSRSPLSRLRERVRVRGRRRPLSRLRERVRVRGRRRPLSRLRERVRVRGCSARAGWFRARGADTSARRHPRSGSPASHVVSKARFGGDPLRVQQRAALRRVRRRDDAPRTRNPRSMGQSDAVVGIGTQPGAGCEHETISEAPHRSWSVAARVRDRRSACADAAPDKDDMRYDRRMSAVLVLPHPGPLPHAGEGIRLRDGRRSAVLVLPRPGPLPQAGEGIERRTLVLPHPNPSRERERVSDFVTDCVSVN